MRAQDSLRALLLAAVIVTTIASSSSKECITSGAVTSKLYCYYSDATQVNVCKCSHIILPETTPVDQLNGLIQDKGAKVLLTVNRFNENLIKTLNATKVFGLEIQLKKMDSKQDILDFISTAKTKLGKDLYIALSVPAKPEILAKYYDFKSLSKHVDDFTLQTHFLGANRNVTFHPSRLSGLWDIQNTDSVVDLATGLGAPLSKLVISTPVQAFKFQLQNKDYTAPGSPALELSTLTRDELCATMESDKWTLERDQDQAGPYIFREDKWISFEDATSMDIKAKYARVRGLAGIALKDISQDGGSKCGETLLEAAFNGLTKQSRAPRGAVLHSLEREILETPVRPFDNIQVSPYRISRIIDTEGAIHAVRKDTRTEFQCSRQGYFVHPRSCNRFYRCVKYDQQSDEFSVFEFDCPAGLAFDERVEVCVWPGSLPNGAACAGSSEIAPVPKERFICPEIEGYYADPENCRWFFACMDHGKSPLTAYEFRCPYGLVFDQENLLCEWSWLVPKCASGLAVHEEYYGGFASANGVPGSIVGSNEYVESRNGAFDLDIYDGLGSLNHIKLGGLSGPLQVTEAKTYSNYVHGNDLSGVELGLEGSLRGNTYSLTGNNYHALGNTGSVHYTSGENIASAAILGTTGNLKSTTTYDRHGAGRISDYGYYHGHSLDQQQNVNIVAGGSSGVASYAPNVDVLQHGVKIDVESITPATLVSSTVSPIPIVTKVPIPSTAQFDSSNLGVVANFPNLQYKLENPTIINHQLHQLNSNDGHLYSASNISLGYFGYPLSSVQVPVQEFGSYNAYSYTKPQHVVKDGYAFGASGIFGEKPLTPAVMKTYTYEQKLDSNNYLKPQVDLHQAIAYKPVTPYNIRPIASYHQVNSQPQLYQPAYTYQGANVQHVQTYNQANQHSTVKQEGYIYNKPQVSFVEGSTTTHDSKSTGYYYNNPEIRLEEKAAFTPALTYQQVLQPVAYHDVKIQPSIETLHVHQQYTPKTTYQETKLEPEINYYQINQEVKQEHQGYHYEKPAIKFEEKAVVPATYQEVKIKSGQPATTYQEIKHEGYHYEKPVIQPIVPTTTYHEEVKVQPIQPAVAYQEVKQEGYHYEKPAIKFEEKPIVPTTTYHQEIKVQPIQPAVAYQEAKQEFNGYLYEKPAIKFEETPIVPTTTYQEIKIKPVQPAVTYQEVKHEGYHYEKPAIKFEEKAVHPAVAYQEIKHETKQEGYHYEKPTITFEEKPISTTAYQNVNVQPAVSYQEVNHEIKQGGYHYEKPHIAFEEKRVIPVKTYQEVKIQPAVTYQNVKIQPAVSFHEIKHETKQEGYSYEKPAIAFEEKPIVKVEPAVTYQEVKHEVNPGYHYEKPVHSYLPVGNSEKRYQAVKVSTPTVTYLPQKGTGDQHIQIQSYHEIKHHPGTAYQEIKHQPITNYQEVKHEGYHYDKPKVVLQETPTPIVPVTTYQNVQPVINYHYEKPQAEIYQEIKHQPVTTYQQVKHEGYHYEKPAIKFEEKPIVPTTTYQQEIKVQPIQPAVAYHEVKHEHHGYHYEKPVFKFEEKPIVPTTTYQEVKIKPVQPAVTYQEVKHEGYHYEKPKVIFEEKPAPILPATTYQEVNVQPTVTYHYQKVQPAIQTYQEVKHEKLTPVTPVTYQEVNVQPIITNNYQKPQPAVLAYQKTIQEGYHYEKPKIAFEEKPVVPVAPVTTYQEVKVQQPAITHHYQKPQPSVTYQEVRHEGYHYDKPKIIFEEKPVTPATYVNFIQPKPTPILSTYHEVKPLLVETKPTYKQVIQAVTPKPAVINSFSINQYSQGYHYDKPAIVFEEKPQTQYLPAKPTYLPPKSNPALNYIPPKPVLQYVPAKPISTPSPPPAKIYLPQVPVQTYISVPQPTRVYKPVKTIKPVQTYYQEYYNAKEIIEQPAIKTTAYKTGYHYDKPAIKFEEYTTPRPTYTSTVASVVHKIEPAQLHFTSYDSRLEKVEPIKVVQPVQQIKVVQPVVQVQPIVHEIKTVPVTSKPIVRYEFSSLPVQPVKQQEFLINVPEREYLPVTRRPVIVTKKEYLPPSPPKRVYLPVTTTTERYLEVTTPSREYLPVTQEILRVRTSTPAKEYLPVTTRVRTRPTTTKTTTTTTKPSREYLPVKSTTPAREYLPVQSTQPPREYLPAKSTTPSKEYLPVTPRPRKPNREYLPVKVENYEYKPNDQPISSTRRPKVIKVVKTRPIVKTNDFHPILSAKLGAQCTCTSNTLTLRRRKPQKSDATTRISDLEEYIVPNEDQLELQQYNKPRKESVIIVAEEEEDVNQDDEMRQQDIAKAVNSGLKLVKSAVKQGVKEGVQEALSGKDFDRYGPGGVRGRSETLQGTVDCQRAGLFRHPKHCNKFYACRWDESKKKFTLHVFNCPVHLTFDNNLGACNWPSQGPACVDNTLLPSD